MLMSGLRLSLLSDAVCHKGNSPSQLAILGVTEELVGTVSRLKLNCPWWSHERSLARRLAASCVPPDTWPRASNIVFWRRCARRWSVYWISPLLWLKVCQRRNVELVTSVCVTGKVALPQKSYLRNWNLCHLKTCWIGCHMSGAKIESDRVILITFLRFMSFVPQKMGSKKKTWAINKREGNTSSEWKNANMKETELWKR